jgi:hypothetical protein
MPTAPATPTDPTPAAPTPGIHIEKTAGTGAAYIGDPVPYTVRVANTGPEPLKNIVVTDTRLSEAADGTLELSLAPGGALTSADYTFHKADGRIEMSGAFTLSPGDALVIRYAVVFSARGTYKNEATAAAVGADYNTPAGPAQDDATVEITQKDHPSNPPSDEPPAGPTTPGNGGGPTTPTTPVNPTTPTAPATTPPATPPAQPEPPGYTDPPDPTNPPRYSEPIDDSLIPQGWVQIQKTDPDTGETYWELEPEDIPLTSVKVPKTGGFLNPHSGALPLLLLVAALLPAAGAIVCRRRKQRRVRQR